MALARSRNVTDAVELGPSNLLGIVSPDIIEPLRPIRTTESSDVLV
jgi:hypothetical protein